MPRYWTMEEDQQLVAYYDAVSPAVLAADLGRPEAAVKARARMLRSRGGWDALATIARETARYHLRMQPGMSAEARIVNETILGEAE